MLTRLLTLMLLLPAAVMHAQDLSVLHSAGLLHGFLVLRTLDGTALADGDLTQLASGDRITARLAFRFKDGSTHEETTVYSQRRRFRLISDRLIQKGPAFPRPLDMSINGTTGRVTVRSTDDKGKPQVDTDTISVPPDLANGLLPTLLENVRNGIPPKSVSLVAATPKPRLVKLAISVAGEEPFTTGSTARKATHYVVKVDIGGLPGLLAPLLGKQPPDSHVWILGGSAPAFVKAEQQLYLGGPLWRIELTSPVWPKATPASGK